MFEALFALVTFSTDLPDEHVNFSAARTLKVFFAEEMRIEAVPSVAAVISPRSNANSNPGSRPDTQKEVNEDAVEIVYVTDQHTLQDKVLPQAESKVLRYPSSRWFRKHREWIELDQRLHRTRGQHALFQDWSPF